MNKRKIALLAMSLCMVAVLAVGGTLAYFQDTDSKTNVFTVGNVQITQNEKDENGNDYGETEKDLFPIVNDGKDADGRHTGKNYIHKVVTVTNDGSRDAYVRTHLAIPAVLDDGPSRYDAGKNILHWNGASAGDTFNLAQSGELENGWYWDTDLTTDWPSETKTWNFYQATVDDVLYNVYVATHKDIVPAGKTTSPSLYGVYLDKDVDYNGTSYVDQDGNIFEMPASVKVLVASEAVQEEGFAGAIEALDAAFGAVGTYCPFAGGTIYTAP